MTLARILRRRRARTRPPEGLVPAAEAAARARRAAEADAAADGPIGEQERELLAREERLTERFTLLQAELGGVFYEMAIRDHIRMEVLLGRAAQLQRVDAELLEVRRARHGEPAAAAAGRCPICAAVHPNDARYCGRCGHALIAASNGAVAGPLAPPAPGAGA